MTVVGVGACAVFEDNGTHLAFALERESRALEASSEVERGFDYTPLTGADQRYEIKISPSHSDVPPFGGYLIVTGANGGGTTYQGRSVYIARRFEVRKSGAPAHLVLRKHDGRIELVDVS